MFRKFFDWLSSETQTKTRKFRNRQLRRDRFQREMWRQCRVEPLEDRRLLAVFSNPAPIAINDDAVATPYPSTITLPASVTATALDVNATLFNVSHSAVADINVLLTAPAGGNVELMRFAGSGPVANETWTFDDGAPAMPFFGDPGSGTFSPTQFGVPVAYPGPAPASPYGTAMAAVAGGNAAGNWQLFVLDSIVTDSGTIAGGWSLDIQLGGNVVINAGVDANDTAADTFEVRLDGANLVVEVNNATVFDEPFAGVTSLTIDGSNDDDTLTVDFGNGHPIPAGGLIFNGGLQATAAGDALVITGNAAPFINQVFTFTGADSQGVGTGFDGNIDLDGSAITFTGLEPISGGDSVNTTFNLPTAVANVATLQDHATPGRIEIVGATFEDTDIPNPTNSLTVNLGDAGDVLNVTALDAAYAASLIINGGAANNDNVQLTNVDLINTPGRGLEVTEVETLGVTNGTISGNTADRGGGVLMVDSTTSTTIATFDGATISGNTATGVLSSEGGGGIFNQGADLTIQNNSLISNNVANGANGSGGGIFNDTGSMLTIIGSTITANSSLTGDAGAIQNQFGATLIVDSSTLSGNTAGDDAGGIENDGTATIQNGSLITANSASDNGGGIFNDGGSTLTVNGSTISGNDAGGDGGGIWNSGSLTMQNNTVVSGNSGGDDGGGLFLFGGSAAITNTTITGNTASGNAATNGGGGIFNSGLTLTFGNTVSITNNVADGTLGSGGGIFNDGGIVTLNGSAVTGNEATIGDGGGIYNASGSTVNIVGADVSNNTAGGDGGGIWNAGTLTAQSGTTVNSNTATTGDGGGIFNTGTLIVDGATLAGNDATAGDGGGIWNDGSLTLQNATVISGNTASGSGGDGGGLYLDSASGSISITNTTITGNTASGDAATNGGGGIFNDGLTLTLGGTVVITNNVADGTLGSGGGIFNAGGIVTLNSTLIVNNRANRAGGGIETVGGTVTLNAVFLANNNAGAAPAVAAPGNGGGLHATGAGNVIVNSGTVITGNAAAAEGGGLWNSDTGTLTIDAQNTADILIVANTAAGDAAPGVGGVDLQGGGGIFNDGGTVILTGTDNVNAIIIAGNNAVGATNGSGGGILSIGGTVDGGAGNPATNILISGNTAVRAGGGVEIVEGSLNLENSRIVGNFSVGNGGAIHITGNGLATLDAVTIRDNAAGNEGGGLWNSAEGTFTVTNSTISGNIAAGGDGGGIFSTGGGLGVVDLDSVTITLNSAGGSGAGIASGAGGTRIENTIVAQNPGGGTEDNLSGTVASEDFNLIGNPDDGTLTGLTMNTIFGADAMLLPLSSNNNPNMVDGVVIETHLPAAGSPAINFGSTTLTVDQRDVFRPQGAQDDIGAVEATLSGFVISADDLASGQAGDGNPDEFLIINDAGGLGGDVQVFINSVLVFSQPKATTGLIVIRGSADDDTLIVDNSNGLIGANIVFDADGAYGSPSFPVPGGFDRLILIGTTPTNTTYNPGETLDAGAVFQENDQIVQRVEFFGLEPIQVVGTGAGDTLTVAGQPLGVGFPQALNADNVINYVEGPNSNDPVDPVFLGALTGLITIDGFESLEFTGFGTLNVEAGAGSDAIHLNNPVTPGDLAAINIAGGDPTASDTLIVNGRAGLLDSLRHNPTGQWTGNVVNDAGGQAPVNFTGIEHLTLVVQQADGDDVRMEGTIGDDRIEFFHGVTGDSGTFRGTMDANNATGNGPFTLTETTYFGVSGAANDVDVNFFNPGGTDTFEFNGTAANDTIAVGIGDGAGAEISNTVNGAVVARLELFNMDSLVTRGHAGDDTFTITGNHGLGSIAVEGGSPSASDVLNFVGAGALITVEVDAQTVTEAGFGPVAYTGIERVNVDAALGPVDINGSLDDDAFTVRPNDATGAEVTVAGVNTVFQIDNTLDLEIDGVGGLGVDNSVTVIATEGDDIIAVTDTNVALAGRLPVNITDIQRLIVLGRGGDDTFNVTPSAATEMFIDGGDAIGVTGDSLVLTATSATAFAPGPEGDEGGFAFAATLAVSYDRIEGLALDLANNTFEVAGTNGDDSIKVQGTGATSYLLSVNDSPAMVVTNSGELTVDGLHGSDRIDIDVRSLDLAGLTVRGNNPAIEGDTLTVTGVLGGADNATWRPGAFDGGLLTTGAQAITVETIERLIYSGENEAENLTVILPAAQAGNLVGYEFDPFTFHGSVHVNRDGGQLLGIEFQNISAAGGTVTIDGVINGAADTLFYGGRDEVDQIAVSNGGVIANAPLALPVLTPGVEDLVLLGRNGADVFDIASDHPYASIIVTGDGPDAGDMVLVRGAARAETITVQPNPYIDSETYITGTGVNQARNISVSAVERIYYLGTGDDALVVNPGQGTHAVRVDGGRFTGHPEVMPGPYDQVSSDSLPQVFGGNLETLRIAPAAGAAGNVSVTFVTGDLTQATQYEAVLGGDDTLVIEGSNALADRHMVTRPAAGSVRVVDTLSGVQVTETSGDLGRLQISTLGGDDEVTVDNTNGLVGSLITYDGGTGSDLLRVTGATAVQTVEYLPGPAVGEGRLLYDGGAMTIDFLNLEPVIDLVPAAELIVNGTNADNAISYTAGANSGTELVDGAATGQVAVNGFETIEFAAKTTLTIDALGGSDTISLNNSTTPTGLTGISVAGGDPTASDAVIVNGTTGPDAIIVDLLSLDGARISGAQPVPVTVTTVEHLTIHGRGGNDSLTIIAADDDEVELTPDVFEDAGSVAISNVALGPVQRRLPLDFRDLGAGGSLTFASVSGVRNLDLLIFGTGINDRFEVSSAGVVQVFKLGTGFFVTLPINTPGADELFLEGLDGDDAFNVAGDHPFEQGVHAHGGNPSASDVLNFAGSGGAISVDLEAQSVTEVNPVFYTGVEIVNVNAADAALSIAATSGDDDVTVTVLSATAGSVARGPAVQKLGELQRDPVPPVVNYSEISGALSVDLAGGEDTLIVVGNALSQTFNVNASGAPFAAPPLVPPYGPIPANTVQIDDLNDLSIDGAVTFSNTESLQIYGLEGNDTFNVIAGPIPVFVDGGDPIGTVPGDAINVFGATGFFPGPEPDEGGFLTPGETISFDHIEVIGFIVSDPDCPFLIVGTNGDDDITVIARDDSTHPAADGVQDFTFSVNGSGEILVLNQSDLYIDALSGDDDIVIRTRAPNGANWGVHIRVVGGAPSAVTGDQGDVLQIETPFGSNDNAIYTPTGSDTGTVLIDENGNQTHDAGIDTLIEILAFIPDLVCPPEEGPVLHVFSRGGVEQLIYDGEGAGDSLTVNGTAGGDTIVHTPHAGIDEGHVRVNTLLGISYQNLGAGAGLTIDGGDGDDTLAVDGTSLSDSFTVAAATGSVTLANAHGTRLAVGQANVENLVLNGLDGDDTFTVNATQPYASVAANGGGPGASDVLVVNGAAGVDEGFTVTPDFGNGSGTVVVNALAIPYTGVEHLRLDANDGDTDTLAVNDDLADNVWTVKAGPIFGDRIQIDSRESIDYVGFDAVTLINQFGADQFVIHPTHLVGSAALTVIADPGVVRDDVVTIVGTEGDDVVTATADTVTVNAPAGVPVTIGGGGAGFAELQILTLGGDDVIGHDGSGGNAAPLALALPGVRKFVDAGAGNDTVNMSLTQDAVIFGGDGDDVIVGTPLADFIDGGRGDDTIFGLGGDDVIYGGQGNDTIIGGAGFDRMFGGDGSDTLIWNPGDGSDLVEGGSDEADVLVFNGSDAAEVFHIFADLANPSRALLFRSVGNLTIDMAGIEEIQLNTLGGADTVNVGRSQAALGSQLSTLTTTDVKVVNVDLAAAAGGPDATADTVVFEGRALDDSLFVSVSNDVVQVAGLDYSLFIRNSATADSDLLDVRGNDGNDRITIAPGVSAAIGVRLFGDGGDDVLTGDVLELHGGDGDDLLMGGLGNNLFFGGAGEDTMVGNGGSDTFDGGLDFDTILIRGTSFDDRIDLRQDSPTQLRHEIGNPANLLDGVLGGVGTITSALVIATVEQVRIEAGAGDDIIRVAHDDSLVAAGIAVNMLRIDVRGGAPGASDRLTVVDDGAGDTTIQRIGGTPGEGTFTMYAFSGGNPAIPIIPLPPVVYTEVEYASLHPISPVSGGTGADGNGRLFVFKHDPFEQNQSRVNATFLGANQTTNVDPVIDPGTDVPFGTPGDEDWYRIVAEVTGTLDIQLYFRQQGTLANGRAGLPGDGNLEIALYDADGLVNGAVAPIAGTGTFGTNDADDDERIRIPAVAGQTYYLRVVGAPLPAGDDLNVSSAINIYNVSVVNHAPPMPFDLELADNLTILTGGQEVPAVNTIANGTANFQYNAAANTFDLDLFVSGIELTDLTALPELTGAHIHVGPVGVNGPVIVDLGIIGWQVESAGIRLQLAAKPFSAVPANIADLLAGNTYINVHSTANLGGEIRAQILIQNVLGVSDSGRSQFDNVTRDNTPTILLRLDDAILLNDLPGNAAGVPGAPPPDQLIPIPFNPSNAASPVGLSPGYRVAIYDEVDMHNPVFLGFAQPVPNLNGVYSFTFVTPLSDGSHFISARVQMIDPADNDVNNATLTRATGFGPRSQSLEIIVDTTPPPVFFGFANDPTDGLVPDPGVIPQPPFFVDNKTADQTPAFWGTAEANAIVRVYADLTPDDGVDNFDVLLGMTVALPFDGTNQYPNGQWRVSSNIDLNDPAYFPLDGLRRILVTAEDLAGNVNPGPGLAAQVQALQIFLDTQAPQVTGVFATNLLGLLPGNTLLRFNAASPFSIAATLPITGLVAGDTVIGIDLRPANGLVYAVANGPDPDALYTINPLTGAATFIANLSVALSGTTFGVDFDPVTDTLRIVSDADINYSVNPVTGVVTAQAALNPGNPNIAGAAYTNNNAGALSTSLYTIDFGTDVLNLQDPQAAGTQVVVGPLGIDVNALLGFDIVPGNNIAFAAMTNAVNGQTGLYTIDLTTGAATLIGDIRDGTTSLLGLTAISEYDIFDPKPSTDGPTPLLSTLFIRVQDFPGREDPFDNPALNPQVAIAVGHFRLVGDANGIIPIQSVQFIPDPFVPGQPAGGTIVLTFFEPLPDDRFTLILNDSLVDDVGNALDGESNAAEPQGNPQFPTGDGQPGGNFVARFTVDSRPELGVYHSGSVWVDTNGNFTFDPHNLDYTNRDIVYVLGYTTDNLFAGNFSPPGPNSIADGFDKLAAYGKVGNNFRWLIDTDNDGVPNPPTGIIEPLGVTGIPVAGNFDGNAINGDEVGLFSGSTWYFDTTHNYQLDTILSTPNMSGIPIVGDFNGDGADDLGVWKDDRFTFLFTTGGVPRSWVPGTEVNYNFGFIGVREKPVATDMDRDGIDDIGLWVPDRAGVAPEGNGEWYFLISAGVPWPQRIAAENGRAEFTPVPFGKDMYASFGDEFAVPIVGNFDPPVTPPSSNVTSIGLTNLDNRFDVNADGIVNALDALIQINDANANGQRTVGLGQLGGPYLDVNGDGWISPSDVLATVNYLNSLVAGGEGEGTQGGDSGAMVLISPVATLNSTAEQSPAGVPHAGLLTDIAPRSGAVRTVAAQVDPIFAENDETDDLSVYAGDLVDAVLVGTSRGIRPNVGNAVTDLALDDVLVELAADQSRQQESSIDGFFARVGRLFR